VLRLFAPFLPYATEEVWSWWQEGTVHRAAWPSADGLRDAAGTGDAAVLATVAAVLAEVRKAKSDAKVSMRAEVAKVEVTDTPERLALIKAAAQDLADAGRIAELVLTEGDAFVVTVTLADPPA